MPAANKRRRTSFNPTRFQGDLRERDDRSARAEKERAKIASRMSKTLEDISPWAMGAGNGGGRVTSTSDARRIRLDEARFCSEENGRKFAMLERMLEEGLEEVTKEDIRRHMRRVTGLE